MKNDKHKHSVVLLLSVSKDVAELRHTVTVRKKRLHKEKELQHLQSFKKKFIHCVTSASNTNKCRTQVARGQ
uniref:Uncharacterized protein n=1 Tax=Tetraselmis sp. GSL018 TaxID=582737 RepID=A0A061RII0_9CHLO